MDHFINHLNVEVRLFMQATLATQIACIVSE